MRNSFLVRREYYDHIKKIKDESEKRSLIYAIVKYGIEEKETYPYEKHRAFLSSVYKKIDEDYKKYQYRKGLS